MTGVRAQHLGELLREWRRVRRLSQLDLACSAEISTKHLSLLETGRSQPSRQMLLHLAACLEVPLRGKNVLLSAAGLDPLYEERAFDAPALDQIRHTIGTVLAAHDPHPAVVVDRHWSMLSANRAVSYLVAGVESVLLRPPVNMMRLLLHPAGLASRIFNLAQWREHVIARLRRQIDLAGDPTLTDLLEEIRDYPCPSRRTSSDQAENDAVAMPLRIATIDGVLSFFWTTTRFEAPVDITVAELGIEAFFPSDAETALVLQRVAVGESTPVMTSISSAVVLE
jgi:transcriptional regulator with XRE-family HTH domain